MIKSVIIDSREPKWVQRLPFCGAKKAVMEMEFGDIWLTCDDGQTLVIERKEPEDFIGSMITHRLIRQAAGLAQLRKGGLWPYVMITGEINPGPNGRSWVNGDLREIHCEEWLEFIRGIAVFGGYEVVILDMGDQIEEWFQILRECKSIYMPILEDPISTGKLLQFEKILRALEFQDIKEKIKKLRLPCWNEPEKGADRMEWLLRGELGYFVRKLVAEEQRKNVLLLGEDGDE